MPHGQGTETLVNGSKRVGAWEDGELNGFAMTYHKDGTIHESGFFDSDK